jgi:hypothetical protein
MSEMISLPVNAIPEPDRRSLENLLGHPLQANQQVFVMVCSAGQAADEGTRHAAAERIRCTLANIDRHRADNSIAEDQVDAAIDEAMEHVRPRH